jgi:hypothetical protein
MLGDCDFLRGEAKVGILSVPIIHMIIIFFGLKIVVFRCGWLIKLEGNIVYTILYRFLSPERRTGCRSG